MNKKTVIQKARDDLEREKTMIERVTGGADDNLTDAAYLDLVNLIRDARRYRRLRVLGCAVHGTAQLELKTVVRFTSLDAIIDADFHITTNRGEAE